MDHSIQLKLVGMDTDMDWIGLDLIYLAQVHATLSNATRNTYRDKEMTKMFGNFHGVAKVNFDPESTFFSILVHSKYIFINIKICVY